MYSIKFTLKQHTPLIHFQHDQQGATLRASEVKPKLDKFLFRVCDEMELQILEKNITNENSNSLSYRLRINSENILIEPIPEKYPCFFGNMGTGAERKEFSFTQSPITCIIQSGSEELRNLIKSKIAGFFCDTNFGMRQSKGFGSYYIHPNDLEFKQPEYFFSFFDIDCSQERTDFDKLKKVFGWIEVFYKAMRAGINETSYRRNGIYMKPIIWQYYKNKGINWEKRLIKKKFADAKLAGQEKKYIKSFDEKDNPVTHDAQNYRLIKDLFGFATDEDAWEREYGFKIGKSHPTIERFMSPVKFKPIFTGKNKCRVYLDAAQIPEEIFNQLHSFTISNKQGRTFTINTPEQILDFYEFFDFMLNEIVLEDIIVNYDERNPTVNILSSIFTQLRTN